jgi:hypothetical protein
MKLFLSHSQADREVARKLSSRLSAAGFNVWEGEEVGPGENWALAVGKALEEADAMIVLLSPRAMKSDALGHEIEYALASPRYKNRLIPVLLRPTRRIPWILRKLPLIRLYEDPEEGADRIVDGVRQLGKANN